MRTPTRFVGVLLLSLLAGLPTAHASGYEPQITNGHDATPGAQPFMVGLLHAEVASSFDAQFCGGSLVDPSWVLTAAHCVFDSVEADDLDVLVGGHDLSANDGTRVRADGIVVHEAYSPDTQLNDIALVHLSAAQSASLIDAAGSGDVALESAGTNVTLLGWGGMTVDQENQTYATVLQQADMPVVDDGTCAGELDGFDASAMLCAGAPEDDADGGVDACQGDSGGPLFATVDTRRVQIGIVSFGPTCGLTLTAYTSVSTYESWIDTTIAAGVPDESGLPTDVFRIAGANRYETAADFALDRFVAPLSDVYLVTGTGFADALAVAPLAHSRFAPVLLTQRDELPPETAAAIQSLAPDRVIVVGGTGAVSDAVAAQAGAISGSEVGRIAGVDRYDTAAKLSRRVGRDLPEEFPRILLASGRSFADALGGAAGAASDPEVPLLLTEPDALPEFTRAELARFSPEAVYVLGGTGAISEAVADEVRALGIEVIRIAGATRYDTAAQIATTIFSNGATEVLVATGSNFPDALVAGALGLPILLLPAPDAVPPSITGAVGTLGAQVITIMGGTGGVSDAQGRTLGDARAGG